VGRCEVLGDAAGLLAPGHQEEIYSPERDIGDSGTSSRNCNRYQTASIKECPKPTQFVEDGVSDFVGPGFNSPHLHQDSTSGLISSGVASTHPICVLADTGTVLMGVHRIRLHWFIDIGGRR